MVLNPKDGIYIIELEKVDIIGREHEYIHQLHHSNDETFQKNYQINREKYFTRLIEIPVLEEEEGEVSRIEAKN